jgi:hypothetical protein
VVVLGEPGVVVFGRPTGSSSGTVFAGVVVVDGVVDAGVSVPAGLVAESCGVSWPGVAVS